MKRALALLASTALAGLSTSGKLPSWSELSHVYQYNSKDYFVHELADAGMDVQLNISEPTGDIAGALYRRPGSKGPYGCVLLMHGLTGSKEQMMRMYGPMFTQAGFAVLAVDAPGHGARQKPSDFSLIKEIIDVVKSKPSNAGIFYDWHFADRDGRYNSYLYDIHQRGVLDYRKAIDWLMARPEIDHSKIGALGTSLGANMAAVLGGVDSRVKTVTLCVGGDIDGAILGDIPNASQIEVAATSPSLFIGHMAGRSVTMLNAEQDRVVPKQAAWNLYNAASSPKNIEWVNCGHQYTQTLKARAVSLTVRELQAPADPQPSTVRKSYH